MKKLTLRSQTVADLQINDGRRADATNSSECKWCSCEQHCEQAFPAQPRSRRMPTDC